MICRVPPTRVTSPPERRGGHRSGVIGHRSGVKVMLSDPGEGKVDLKL